jgi:CMP-N,N'-diacetyllegionaminic acid synthase
MVHTLALIPARGGSKGIPRKNIAPLAGLPLVAWSIRAAHAAATPLRVVVSTEDTEIAEVSRACGAEVPFLRPVEMADDTTGSDAPVRHALDWFRTHEAWTPEYIMLLQPTSPLRTAEDIDMSLRLIEERQADAVVGVTPVRQHPAWVKVLDADGWVKPFLGTTSTARRQDLPDAYAINGAMYLIRTAAFLNGGSFYPERTVAHIMPAERSVDIDTPWDLWLAGAELGRSRGAC